MDNCVLHDKSSSNNNILCLTCQHMFVLSRDADECYRLFDVVMVYVYIIIGVLVVAWIGTCI